MTCNCNEEDKCASIKASELTECTILNATVTYLLSILNKITGNSYVEIINIATKAYYDELSLKLKSSETEHRCQNKDCYLCLLAQSTTSCEAMILKEVLEKYLCTVLKK